MELAFEPANSEDIEILFRLNQELIEAYENMELIDLEQVLSWVRRKLELKIGEYTCIYYEGEKAGYFHFEQSGDKMELDDLFLFPQLQGKGIGTAVIERCKMRSELPIFLYVFIRNERAVKLYRRLGFEVIENIRDSRYIMEWKK